MTQIRWKAMHLIPFITPKGKNKKQLSSEPSVVQAHVMASLQQSVKV